MVKHHTEPRANVRPLAVIFSGLIGLFALKNGRQRHTSTPGRYVLCLRLNAILTRFRPRMNFTREKIGANAPKGKFGPLGGARKNEAERVDIAVVMLERKKEKAIVHPA
jgi:hypothetical protein